MFLNALNASVLIDTMLQDLVPLGVRYPAHRSRVIRITQELAIIKEQADAEIFLERNHNEAIRLNPGETP